MAIDTDLDVVEPRVWDPADSGFQYLFNVRRMRTPGQWSATWQDPEGPLGLTMTMLESCA